MLRRFRPFRSSWSVLLVLAALVFTMAACKKGPTTENTNTGCNYNEVTNTCT